MLNHKARSSAPKPAQGALKSTRPPGARGLAPLTGRDAWYERQRELEPQHNLGY